MTIRRALGRAVVAALLVATVPAGSAPVLAVAGTAGTDPSVPEQRVDRWLQGHMARTGTPGLAWAVVGPGGLRAEGALGRDGFGNRVTSSTGFLWGSVAKPVTAALVLRLSDDGVVDLDAAVSRYLPEAGSALSAEVTVRDLVRHTSGLPGLALTDRFDAGRRPTDVVHGLDDDVRPRGRYRYSSTGYLVLAAVVEAATGRPFTAVLDDEVLGPLGMTSAVTTPRAADRRVPPGHRYLAGRAVPFEAPYDPAGVAYGYLGGTVNDLASFAADALADDGEVLGAAGLARSVRGVPPGGYGLGWRVRSGSALGLADGERVVWHGGAAPGYQSAVVLLPERGTGVVVLQNAYGVLRDRQLLDAAFGIASLTGGAAPVATDRGPWSVLAPVLGVLTAGALLLVLARTMRRGVRGVRGGRRRRRELVMGTASTVVGASVVVATLLGLPAATGEDLARAALWAPDLAWSVTVAVGATTACVVARVALTVGRLVGRAPAPVQRDLSEKSDTLGVASNVLV